MLGLEDSNDKNISIRKEAHHLERSLIDKDAVESSKVQFRKFDAFKIPVSEKGVPVIIKDMESQKRESRLQLTSATLATNDVATSEIQQDMLSAENQGRQLVSEHVTSWFIEENVPFFYSFKKNNSKTFKTMYQTTVPGKQNEQKVIKADRRLLQRLLTASMAGRQIKMDEILHHELSSLPLSLARMNGDMNCTSKSDMINILMGDIEVQHSVPAQDDSHKTCIIIDVHALIQALGKPHNCKTFQDYAGIYFKAVTKNIGETVKRIDVLFDTYIEKSMKAGGQARIQEKI